MPFSQIEYFTNKLQVFLNIFHQFGSHLLGSHVSMAHELKMVSTTQFGHYFEMCNHFLALPQTSRFIKLPCEAPSCSDVVPIFSYLCACSPHLAIRSHIFYGIFTRKPTYLIIADNLPTCCIYEPVDSLRIFFFLHIFALCSASSIFAQVRNLLASITYLIIVCIRLKPSSHSRMALIKIICNLCQVCACISAKSEVGHEFATCEIEIGLDVWLYPTFFFFRIYEELRIKTYICQKFLNEFFDKFW